MQGLRHLTLCVPSGNEEEDNYSDEYDEENEEENGEKKENEENKENKESEENEENEANEENEENEGNEENEENEETQIEINVKLPLNLKSLCISMKKILFIYFVYLLSLINLQVNAFWIL